MNSISMESKREKPSTQQNCFQYLFL